MTQATMFDANLARIRAIEADICAGKLHKAAAALNALNAATPADVRIYLAGALLAHAAGNPKQEIASLKRVIALAPDQPLGHMELAKAFSREGRHDEAVAMANKAVALAPQEMMALEVAVAVANVAGDVVTAQRHLQSALALRPADTAISRALGICLAKQSLHGEAEAHWRHVLAENPDDPSALGWLGTCLNGLGRKDEACVVLERAVALSPDNTSLPFHLAIARGETPRTQPREMMQQLFDAYASRFDRHLVGQLKYAVPKRVAEIIRERHAGADASAPDASKTDVVGLDMSVLDLGCGTGLLGMYLGRIGGAFVGVDVSPKMLEHAGRLDIYTDLRQSELLEELQRTEPESFDYLAANDVFIYVGDLTEVIPAAFKALRHGGALIFSCETADDAEGALVLRSSKRYAHSRGSVEMLCRAAGFSSCGIEPIELRFDGGNVPIAGFIAVAQKR
jgi:predicted TPR repeat methyltransferase